MTFDEPDVVRRMRRDLRPASKDQLDRARDFTRSDLTEILEELSVEQTDLLEAAGSWEAFQRDAEWLGLLADVVTMIESHRGDHEAPVPIWPDLEASGPPGRHFYFYVFALCYRGACAALRDAGCSFAEVRATMGILRRHALIHRRKFSSAGVDAGWWMIPTLRGDVVHIESLQFHRLTLGAGSLGPQPWYDDDEAAKRGVGFRRGDAALGVHIPEGTELSPGALDSTFERAREVVQRIWPVHQRRLATCQSWMLDDRLEEYLSSKSNIVRFQRRFELLPTWRDDDEDVVEFVFRTHVADFSLLDESTSVRRAVKDVLVHGGHWRDRIGWLDFDGG